MVTGLKLGALIAVVVINSCLEFAKTPAEKTTSVANVMLCDKADITASEWLLAKAQTERIMASAKIGIHWFDESCQLPSLKSYYTVVVAREFPKDWPPSTDAMGKAVILGGPYPRAYVFQDRVRIFDESNSIPDRATNTGMILGNAIAHELGHLLGQPHSAVGIMRPNWAHSEWMDVVSGHMFFADFRAR